MLFELMEFRPNRAFLWALKNSIQIFTKICTNSKALNKMFASVGISNLPHNQRETPRPSYTGFTPSSINLLQI